VTRQHQTDGERLPAAKLMIVNVIEMREYVSDGRARYDEVSTANDFAQAFEHLSSISFKPDVINVSFETRSELSTLREKLHGTLRHSTLLVASAGNRSIPLSETPYYPAVFGGLSGAARDNVITVASYGFATTHNDVLKGDSPSLLTTSNFGEEYVDIAAPGCQVLAFVDGTTKKHYSGTSQAAPLVSFTAAMIKRLGISSPKRIKQRIIYSARHVDGMDVAASGVLDIAAAINIRHDSVMMTNSIGRTGHYVHGRLSNSAELVMETTNQCRPIQGRTVRSMHFVRESQANDNDGLRAEIWSVGGDGELGRDLCEFEYDGPALVYEFSEKLDSPALSISLEEISSIVFGVD